VGGVAARPEGLGALGGASVDVVEPEVEVEAIPPPRQARADVAPSVLVA
jgi:hypothetical protein